MPYALGTIALCAGSKKDFRNLTIFAVDLILSNAISKNLISTHLLKLVGELLLFGIVVGIKQPTWIATQFRQVMYPWEQRNSGRQFADG